MRGAIAHDLHRKRIIPVICASDQRVQALSVRPADHLRIPLLQRDVDEERFRQVARGVGGEQAHQLKVVGSSRITVSMAIQSRQVKCQRHIYDLETVKRATLRTERLHAVRATDHV